MSTATLDTTRQEQTSLRRRTLELLKTEIGFIPNPKFAAEEEAENPVVAKILNKVETGPADLPAHLRRMCESALLTAEQERALFREMNLLKFRANAQRSRLDPERLDPRLVENTEALLKRAEAIRDHLIQANTRLAISIVKKFVTPQQSFDEMLSDGVLTLMQAVEKFDFERGFRFSTYAYRAIARNAYRSVSSARKEEARFTRDVEKWAFEQEDDGASSALSEQLWNHLRELTASMLDQLDRRERFIIRCRFALGAHRKVRALQYLADKLGVSKERVRQLEQRAVAKLRTMAAERELDEYLAATT